MPNKFVESARDPLAEERAHLAEMRNLHRPPPPEEKRARIWNYKRVVVMVFESMQLDPERAVLEEWQNTPYDYRTSVSEKNGQIDAGDGYGVVLKGSPPYKVRSLDHGTLGQVIEVDALKYWMIKCAESNGRRPRWEPVPQDTKLREPFFPKGFPSCHKKARALAAKALRKAPEEISVAQIIEHWKTRGSKPEIFPA